jgi:hypothetical protein
MFPDECWNRTQILGRISQLGLTFQFHICGSYEYIKLEKWTINYIPKKILIIYLGFMRIHDF